MIKILNYTEKKQGYTRMHLRVSKVIWWHFSCYHNTISSREVLCLLDGSHFTFNWKSVKMLIILHHRWGCYILLPTFFHSTTLTCQVFLDNKRNCSWFRWDLHLCWDPQMLVIVAESHLLCCYGGVAWGMSVSIDLVTVGRLRGTKSSSVVRGLLFMLR